MLIKKTEKMKQTERQKLIAAAMEEEKSKLFRYACYRLGDEKDAEDILQDLFITLSRSPEIVEKAGNLNNDKRANCILCLSTRAKQWSKSRASHRTSSRSTQ